MSEWISNFLRDDHLYYGDNDYDDNYLPDNDPMPGGDADGLYDDTPFDDGILESIVIVGLAAALVVLIWYRQQHQQAHRREEEAARAGQGDQAVPAQNGQQQADRGVFPQPGDPEFGQWVAGGVGH